MKEIVEAGAGCGKTYGLVTRYLAALGVRRDPSAPRYPPVMPSKILTLTFTNDAADEMRSRIIAALREANRLDLAAQVEEQGRISTFHSFCYKVLKPHLFDLGYPSSDILSEVESQAHKVGHILKALAESPLSEEIQKLLDLRKLVNFCSTNWRRPFREIEREVSDTYLEVQKSTNVWLDETLDLLKSAARERPDFMENAKAWPYQTLEALNDRNWPALASIAFHRNYKKWWAEAFPSVCDRARIIRDFAQKQLYRYLDPKICEEEIRSFGLLFEFLETVQSSAPRLLDFDALEFETLAFLRTHPDKSPRYDLLIVDEFQDTNKRQVEILGLISHANTELYYVGDPKQAIYSFRGGDVRVFEAQKMQLENLSLDINRRSLPNVLQFMNALTKTMFIAPDDPVAQTLRPCDEKIAEGASKDSRVIITRVGDKKSPSFWDALAQDLLEGQTAGGTQAILCQKWRSAFEAYEQLRRHGVKASLGNDLDVGRHHLSALWIAFLKTIDGNALATQHWNHLAKTWQLTPIAPQIQLRTQDPRSWLRDFVNAANPDRWPQGLLWLASIETWIQNHGAQLRWIPSAQELASSFQKSMNLRLNLEAPQNPLTDLGNENEDRVTITTIHKSKGLQYQNVYLFDLFDGEHRGASFQVTDADDDESLESFKLKTSDGDFLPSLYFKKKKTLESEKVLSEKKRLFYVAYTRAESNLHFYVSDKASRSKSSTKNLESQIWQWPALDGVSWNAVVQRASADMNSDFIESRDLESDPSLGIADHVPARDEWTLPSMRKALATPKATPFLRAGARTYIDTVLFADQKTAFETFAAPSSFSKPDMPPNHWIHVGSALHKILEKWNGDTSNTDALVARFHPSQHPHLREALQKLANFEDLRELWTDSANHPERVQRELGVFVHDETYRLSGFADLIWFRSPNHAVILDWKSSSSARAAFDPIKVAKTEAQVSLYAKSLKPTIAHVEIWSLAVIFEPKLELQWLFKKIYS